MSYVIQIVSLPVPARTALDGKYVVDYDPSRPGHDPQGLPLLAHVAVSADVERAKRYDTLEAAWAEINRVDPRNPWRPDGKPNRPLTAFTLDVRQA